MAFSPNVSGVTSCGVPGIRPVIYGSHLCHFYPDRDELVQSLVPFFQAGLLNNERCLWVTADPLPAAQAQAELAKITPDLEARIANGQLRIVDGREWYESSRGMTANDLIARWLKEETDALNAGYRGLRITGNTSFLTPDAWDAFMEYEALVSRAFEGRRIVALCSYHFSECQPSDVLDVIRLHHHTLVKSADGWQVLE
jgi:hypothetical protein